MGVTQLVKAAILTLGGEERSKDEQMESLDLVTYLTISVLVT